MKIFWIVLGVLALVWLGFLSFDRNQIRFELDGMNEKFEQHYNQDNQAPVGDDKGLIDKTEDNVDRAEDEVDENVKMPYEEGKPHLEGTDKIEQQVPAKEEKVVPKRPTDVPRKDKEANAKAGESVVAFLNIPQHKLDGESVVAYADNTEKAYDEQRMEAYQVLNFLEHKVDQSVIAYKQL